MGFVQREIDNLFVRADNFQVVDDKDKIKELTLKNLIKNRKGKLIIIYTENDFREFYRKHCARIPNDNKEFTIIVEDEINIPDEKEIRKLIEIALLDRKAFLERKNTIITDIQKGIFKRYKVRKFFNRSFLEDVWEGMFRFRDVSKLKLKDLDKLFSKKIISEQEYNSIKNIRSSSFTLESDYAIKEIWLIGHTDVI